MALHALPRRCASEERSSWPAACGGRGRGRGRRGEGRGGGAVAAAAVSREAMRSFHEASSSARREDCDDWICIRRASTSLLFRETNACQVRSSRWRISLSLYHSVYLTCSSVDFLPGDALVGRARGVAVAGLAAATRSSKLLKCSSRCAERYGARSESSSILCIKIRISSDGLFIDCSRLK
jgi:hypothetical protein